MATTYSNEATLYLNTSPPTKADGNAVGGRLRRYRSTIDLASQAVGDIVLNEIEAGSIFAYGVMTTTASLGATTVAIGITGTTGKHRTAATFTATNTPTLFGNEAAVGEVALSAVETVRATTAVAALPAAGQLIIDLYYCNG